LGLSAHPDVIKAGKDAIDSHGYGMSFRSGLFAVTQEITKELERRPPEFLGMEDCI